MAKNSDNAKYNFPNQTDLEEPLLRAIQRRGGKVKYSGRTKEALLQELADDFPLTEEQLSAETN